MQISHPSKRCISSLILGLLLIMWMNDLSTGKEDKKKKVKSKKGKTSYGQCDVCRELVLTFKKGMDATGKTRHYGGGDTAWEESKLGAYENSELRLIEITDENLCKLDDSSLEKKCHHLAEKHEDLVEMWWFKEKLTHPDMFTWLCVHEIKACCPNDTFGAECQPCPHLSKGSICGGNGKCHGSGTREGSGSCKCEDGYEGESCSSCSKGFYLHTDNETHTLCEKCDSSCSEEGCHGGGNKACLGCGAGFRFDEEDGCDDVDECDDDDTTCKADQYCVNNQGSYACQACSSECKRCSGPGAESCLECADGHSIQDGKCSDSAGNARPNTRTATELLRFCSFAGLVVTGLIVLKSRNTPLAVVTVVVGLFCIWLQCRNLFSST